MILRSSFLNYRRWRYLKLALGMVLICIFAYALDDPRPAPNGGTWLGYTLGSLSAALILWLMYLGRRKRNFRNGWGEVRGWVSAHVYLGSSLVVIATLHTGFQFGLNIHTLAYALMLCVICSGFYGVWAYRYFPARRNRLKGNLTTREIFQKLGEADRVIKKLASSKSPEIATVVASSIDRTEIGGGLINQLTGRDSSMVVINSKIVRNSKQNASLTWIVSRMTEMSGNDAREMAILLRHCVSRQKILEVIREEIRLSGFQDIWITLHVILSFGLLASLISHVFAIFIYW